MAVSDILLPLPAASDRVLSVREGASFANVSVSTLKREAKAGKLRFLRMSPRRVGIRLSELNRWLEACQTGHQQAA